VQRQHLAITQMEQKIRELGGDKAQVTVLPVIVNLPDSKQMMQVPVFRVRGMDGKDYFIEHDGDETRQYNSFQDWKAKNKLPPGQMTYFADGQMNLRPDGSPNIVTENTPGTVDTFGEWVLTTGANAVGTLTGLASLVTPQGKVANALLGISLTAAGIGVAQRGYSLYDRAQHGQTWTDVRNPEVRDNFVGMGADALSIAAALRISRSGVGLVSSADEMNSARRLLNVGSQYADTAAILNSGVTAGMEYDQMTPEQRLAVLGQMTYWSTMTAISARRAGGLGNLYGKQDIGDQLRQWRQNRTARILLNHLAGGRRGGSIFYNSKEFSRLPINEVEDPTVIQQRLPLSCGVACVETQLRRQGITNLSHQQLVSMAGSEFLNPKEVRDLLNTASVSQDWKRDYLPPIERNLSRIPKSALVQYQQGFGRHWVIVEGLDNNGNVIISDPAGIEGPSVQTGHGSRYTLSQEDFLAWWNGNIVFNSPQ
jgi:Domain of unknown function (DUF4781)/Peptidase C39 family